MTAGSFPERLEYYNMRLFNKKGEKSCIGNCMPISLLITIFKIFLKVKYIYDSK
jgi:hypothetical protein